MTKISKKAAYPIKKPIDKDYFVGSDSELSGKTVNFSFEETAYLINKLNGSLIVNYLFKTDNNINLEVLTEGVFLSENNETEVSSITKLYVNKKNFAGDDLSELYTFLKVNKNSFFFKLQNSEDLKNSCYFNITDVVDHTDYFIFSIGVFLQNQALQSLVHFNVYFFSFDIKSASGQGSEDKFTSVGTISLVDNEITLSTGFEWEINAGEFANLVPYIETIPFSSTGNQRFVLFVANAFDTFEMISGPESTSNPVAPPIPNNTLQVTLLLVTDGVVGEPSLPIEGDIYVKKLERQKVLIPDNVSSFTLFDERHFVEFTNPAQGDFDYFILSETYVSGQNHPFRIRNNTGQSFTLNHLSPSGFSFTGETLLFFQNEENFEIKDKEIIEFVYDTDNNRYDYFGVITDVSGKLDKVTTVDVEKVYIKNADGSQGMKPTSELGGNNEEYNSVLHLGNSICKHPINANWWGVWGMAATVRDNDYVHKFWDLLKINNPSATSNAINISAWESNYATFDKTTLNTAILAADLIVLRLGENVTYYSDFQNQYKILVQHFQTVNPNAKIILGGQFWFDLTKETAMRNVAYELQLPFASVGHLDNATYKQFIGAIVQGDDGNPHTITNAGVANHPNDLGMLEIAKSLFAVLDFEEEESRTFPQVYVYGNIELNDSHNGCLLVIKANSIITVPVSLKPYFKCSVHTTPTFNATFLAGAGVTIQIPELFLAQNKKATLYKNGSAPTYGLYGQTSIPGGSSNGTCVYVATKYFNTGAVSANAIETYLGNFFLPGGIIKPGDIIELRLGTARITGTSTVTGTVYLGSTSASMTDRFMTVFITGSGASKILGKMSYYINTNTNFISMVAPNSGMLSDEVINGSTVPGVGYTIASDFSTDLFMNFFVFNNGSGNTSNLYIAYLKVYRP